MSNEIFTQVDLPTGSKAIVFEGYGKHYFKAMQRAKGDSSLMIKFLIIELVKVDGKVLSENDVDEMHMRDISYIGEVISMMLSNDYMKGM